VLEASTDLSELGRRIRCAREINGRSQEAFADVCRLDRSYFGEIERGEPGRSLFLRRSRLSTRSVDDGGGIDAWREVDPDLPRPFGVNE
jgi:hypothetical protein